MSETEQVVYVNGYKWVSVPAGTTAQTAQTYSMKQVLSAGGNSAVLRGTVISSSGK